MRHTMKHWLAITLLELAINPNYSRTVSRLAGAVRNRLFPPPRPAKPEDFDFVF